MEDSCEKLIKQSYLSPQPQYISLISSSWLPKYRYFHMLTIIYSIFYPAFFSLDVIHNYTF